jgi:hypothetical protein
MPIVATLTARVERRDERIGARGDATCRRGTHRERVQISDISRQGARFTFRTPYHPGMQVWLRLPYLEPLEAHVIWVAGFEAGCRFAAPLHPAIFAVVAQAMSNAQTLPKAGR